MTLPPLSVSIVIYKPDQEVLTATLRTLLAALRSAVVSHTVYLIDNAPLEAPTALLASVNTALAGFDEVHLLHGQGNVGYGRGHNLAIALTAAPYHLVLNPDVELAADALLQGMVWMESHAEFGVIAPCTHAPGGEMQYLCRRYPSLWILFLRGFAPSALRRRFTTELERYQMKQETDAGAPFEPTIISGCFMLFRSSVLKRIGGFEPRFFLYFEDYDLSLRAAHGARVGYLPDMRIMHRGGYAARKGLLHMLLFMRSAQTFFSLHGWRLR